MQRSAVLVSTAASAEADATSGSQVISDLECHSSADSTESDSENSVESTLACAAAKKLYLFGGAFDYFDTIVTSETGLKSSSATSSGVSTATATSSLSSGSSGALP